MISESGLALKALLSYSLLNLKDKQARTKYKSLNKDCKKYFFENKQKKSTNLISIGKNWFIFTFFMGKYGGMFELKIPLVLRTLKLHF